MCLAVPGKVMAIQGDDLLRQGQVDFSGVQREVSLAAVPEVRVGDYVIVHAGMALSVLDEAEAQEVLATLQALGEAAASDNAPAGGGRT